MIYLRIGTLFIAYNIIFGIPNKNNWILLLYILILIQL